MLPPNSPEFQGLTAQIKPAPLLKWRLLFILLRWCVLPATSGTGILGELFDHSQNSINKSALDDPRVLSGPFWAELRVFLAVAKAKSYSKAGEELGMSRPKISRSVQQAASGTRQVSASITNVASAAGETSRSAEGVQEAADNIKTQLGRLNNQVDGFIIAVRAL